jgi:hypothetical protein
VLPLLHHQPVVQPPRQPLQQLPPGPGLRPFEIEFTPRGERWSLWWILWWKGWPLLPGWVLWPMAVKFGPWRWTLTPRVERSLLCSLSGKHSTLKEWGRGEQRCQLSSWPIIFCKKIPII